MASGDTRVKFEDRTFEVAREGTATILDEVHEKGGNQSEDNDKARPTSKAQTVFYNPIQQFNRDLSVLAIRVFAEDLQTTRQQQHGKQKWNGRKADAVPKQSTYGRSGSSAQEAPLQRTPGHTQTGSSIEGKVNAEDEAKTSTSDGQSSGIANRGLYDSKDSIESLPESDGPGQMNAKRKRDDADDEDSRCEPPQKLTKIDRVLEPSIAKADTESLAPKRQPPESTAQTGHEAPGVEVECADPGSPKLPNGKGDPSHLWGPNDQHSSDSKSIPAGPKKSATATASIAPRFRILDALSATGLRALRYAKEIPHVSTVTANDLSASATRAIAVNARYNELDAKIEITTGDALDVLRRNRGKFDCIDLDPYGTATHFLDAAVQSLTSGGLLCVTCTDAGVFASTGYPEKCFSQYGGVSAKGPQSHEAGLRLLLQAIATSAARYGLAIEPLLSLSIDFYIRVFVKLRRSPQEVKFLASKTMVVYNCDSGCGAWTKHYMARTKEKEDKKGNPFFNFSLAQTPASGSTCEHCGFKTHIAGPMWGGPIQNPHFIQRMLDLLPTLSSSTYGTIPRMEGMLTTARDETLLPSSAPPLKKQKPSDGQDSSAPPYPIPRLPPEEPDHYPFFLLPSTLASALRCEAPSANALKGALMGLGFRTTRTHTKPGSIRTDAPWSVVWEVMREWVRQKSPIKKDACKYGTAGWGLMQKDRSKLRLNKTKRELKEFTNSSNDMGEMKTKLEALLWRLNNEEQEDRPTAQELAAEIAQSKGNGQKNGIQKQSEASGPTGVAEVDDLELPSLHVEFNERLGMESEEKRKLVRYQNNPRANWGPMPRAKG